MTQSSTHITYISVIIVSYNVKNFVCAAIESVKKFCPYPYEIIVVDNASADGTQAELKKKYPDIVLIENAFNAGFSGANNQGFAIAKGNYLLMLNPDAELLDENISDAIRFIETSKTNVLLGPRIENPDGTHQVSAWKFQNVFAHFLEAFFLNKLFYPFNYLLENIAAPTLVDSVSGACILMKRELIERVGGLDNNLFWMDDVDLCYRVQEHSGNVIYFPGWKVKHFIGESSKKNFNIVIANQIISKLKFYKKHRQLLNFGLSVWVLELHILIRIILLAPFSAVSKSMRKKFKAYLYTQKRFFHYLLLNKQSVS